MKKLFTIFILMISLLSLTSCSSDKKTEPLYEISDDKFADMEEDVTLEKINITIGALRGTTLMGLAQLMKNNSEDMAANIYSFDIANTPDEIITSMMNGDIDVASVPPNIASILYNKSNGKVQVAAIDSLGAMYIVTEGKSVKSFMDLKGKTLYMSGEGTTTEYVLNYLLDKNDIDLYKDITVVYKSTEEDVLDMVSETKDAIGLLSEPYATMAIERNNKLKKVLDINGEWLNIDEDSSLISGVLVARKEFIEKNEPSFIAFLDEYAESVEYTNANIEDVSFILDEFQILEADIAQKVIPFCNIIYFDEDIMEEKIETFLKIIFEQDASSIGGSLPEKEFYYFKNLG